jgi:hypothetical protein
MTKFLKLSVVQWVLIVAAMMFVLLILDHIFCSGAVRRAKAKEKRRVEVELGERWHAEPDTSLRDVPLHTIALPADARVEPSKRVIYPEGGAPKSARVVGLGEQREMRKASIAWVAPAPAT